MSSAPPPPAGWPSPGRWEALARGEGCPLCADVVATERRTRRGYFVADLPASRLRLSPNQAFPGYCVLTSKRHVREPYGLDRDGWIAWFDDLMRVGRTLDELFRPAKMNFQMLGNRVPHLHCHVQPRILGDPAPGRALGLGDPWQELDEAGYEDLAASIRRVLTRP